MATLRNKRKLAAVSRETPESTRGGRAPNILDPELTQDYISQVSEEIEGRVTKKLSKEFSKTESRILGALSKLDEFLLNPQVRTCSVAAPGTSRSSNLENQGTNEDRPSDDPGPEVELSSPISGAETDPHSNLNGIVQNMFDRNLSIVELDDPEYSIVQRRSPWTHETKELKSFSTWTKLLYCVPKYLFLEEWCNVA